FSIFLMLRITHRATFGSTGSIAIEGLIVLGLNYGLVFVHEIGHALPLVHYDRRIENAAFQLYFGAPTLLVTAPDVLMLDKRRRITQAVAGVFTESLFAGSASIIAWLAPHWWLSDALFKFAVLNYFYIFLNLVPLLELDGYWIMTDLLDTPDLRPRALSFARHDLPRKIARREKITPYEWALSIYAVVGSAFTIVVLWLSFSFWRQLFSGFVGRLWHAGIPTRLILLLLAVVVGGPLIRGIVKLSSLALRRARALVDLLAFRLQTKWRVEAAELIDALPLFSDLPEDALNDLAGRVKLRTVGQGRAVIRQGERPESFFVVRSGELEVIDETPSGERSLGGLARGQAFGELGLLERAPRRATVRARTEAELFEVDRGTFDRLLADQARAPRFGPTMAQAAELSTLPPFAHLSGEQIARVLRYGSWVNVAPGERLVRQGEAGDAFYAIASGQFDVMRDRRQVMTLGPGGHFGELALLRHEKRAATVLATTPARVFRLDRKGFDILLKRSFREGVLRAHGGRKVVAR
ncbi:MAG: cyclic nucleotide-binding domain-containing protein, partial [Actinobacteria bacterium]|nr:cyclic nucleotide-binding domain-containing protein [Actinomycetota bacterium]